MDSTVSEQVALAVLPLPFDEFFARHHAEMVRALALALGDVEFGRDAASEDSPARWNAGRPCPPTWTIYDLT